MALSIKDPDVDRMARELAALRGTTMTQAIADALRHELNRLAPARPALTPKQQAMSDAIMAIAAEGGKLPILDGRDPEEILWGDPDLGV